MKFDTSIARLVMSAIFGAQISQTSENLNYENLPLYYKQGSSSSTSDYKSLGKSASFISTVSQGTQTYTPVCEVLNKKNLYLGLCTEEPEVNASGYVSNSHEINQDTIIFRDHRNYERIEVTDLIKTNYLSHSEGDTSDVDYKYQRMGNTKQLTFNEALRAIDLSNADTGGNWETASYWALWETKTDGQPFIWGELEEPVTTETHEVFIIRKGYMEVYVEPDEEYMYYGAYASEAQFQQALENIWYTDNEGVRRPNPTLPEGLHKISGKDARGGVYEITLDSAGKYVFFASPVDFKGTPMFRDSNAQLDSNNDYVYNYYGYMMADAIVYTGAAFSDSPSNGLTSISKIPEFVTGAPAFSQGSIPAGTGEYIGPFYEKRGDDYIQLGNEPLHWSDDPTSDTYYTNYYYYPSIVRVNREAAYFIYQLMSGVPTPVTDPSSSHPSQDGYYESRNKKVRQFVLSSDTTPVSGKTYYEFYSPAVPTWDADTYSIRVF